MNHVYCETRTAEVTVDVDYQRRLPMAATALISASARFTADVLHTQLPPIPAFVASDPKASWCHLSSVAELDNLPGTRFCEWGSGLGSVSCMAALLGFDAVGIEQEVDLVAAARTFAAQQHINVRFFHASYKPPGFLDGRPLTKSTLDTGYGFGLFDFDVIYVYAWPAEVQSVLAFFSANAHTGTWLLVYQGGDQFCIVKKH